MQKNRGEKRRRNCSFNLTIKRKVISFTACRLLVVQERSNVTKQRGRVSCSSFTYHSEDAHLTRSTNSHVITFTEYQTDGTMLDDDEEASFFPNRPNESLQSGEIMGLERGSGISSSTRAPSAIGFASLYRVKRKVYLWLSQMNSTSFDGNGRKEFGAKLTLTLNFKDQKFLFFFLFCFVFCLSRR